jgi:uncharacterized protein YeaO (DUF488 family)
VLPVPQPDLAVKRIYEDPAAADGMRVLVDRIWPRGVSKERAALDSWLHDLAPSAALRKWYGHDPARWTEFRKRYLEELRSQQPAVESLRRLAIGRRVTLLYAARDSAHSNAAVLKELVTGG